MDVVEKRMEEEQIRQLEHFSGRDRLDIAVNGFPVSNTYLVEEGHYAYEMPLRSMPQKLKRLAFPTPRSGR